MSNMRCVGRTTDIMEAEKLAETYELRGLRVEIVKRKQGSAFFYEVWAEEKKEGYEL